MALAQGGAARSRGGTRARAGGAGALAEALAVRAQLAPPRRALALRPGRPPRPRRRRQSPWRPPLPPLMDAMMRAPDFGNLSAAPGFGRDQSADRDIRRCDLCLASSISCAPTCADLGGIRLSRERPEGRTASRPFAATLTCPAWFAADAVEMMAKGRP